MLAEQTGQGGLQRNEGCTQVCRDSSLGQPQQSSSGEESDLADESLRAPVAFLGYPQHAPAG